MKPIPQLESQTVYILVRMEPSTLLSWAVNSNNPTLRNYWPDLTSAQNAQLIERIKGFNYHLFELELPI